MATPNEDSAFLCQAHCMVVTTCYLRDFISFEQRLLIVHELDNLKFLLCQIIHVLRCFKAQFTMLEAATHQHFTTFCDYSSMFFTAGNLFDFQIWQWTLGIFIKPESLWQLLIFLLILHSGALDSKFIMFIEPKGPSKCVVASDPVLSCSIWPTLEALLDYSLVVIIINSNVFIIFASKNISWKLRLLRRFQLIDHHDAESSSSCFFWGSHPLSRHGESCQCAS